MLLLIRIHICSRVSHLFKRTEKNKSCIIVLKIHIHLYNSQFIYQLMQYVCICSTSVNLKGNILKQTSVISACLFYMLLDLTQVLSAVQTIYRFIIIYYIFSFVTLFLSFFLSNYFL